MSDPTTTHPTERQLRGFMAGDLAPAEIAPTARHLARCARCAVAARGDYDLDAAAASLRRELSPKSVRRAVWLAAAAVMAAFLFLGVWTSTRPAPASRHAAIASARAGRPEWDALVAAALAQREVTPPAILRELRPAPSALRAAEPSARSAVALQPVGEVVESDRPRFSWTPVAGATSYRVLLFSRGLEVAHSAPLTAAEWQPATRLARGEIYQWQIIAATERGEVVLPPPEAPRALFEVLPAAAAAEIAVAAHERPDDALLLGLLYARAGVARRAEEELRTYAAAHPTSAAAAGIHRNVAGWRR